MTEFVDFEALTVEGDDHKKRHARLDELEKKFEGQVYDGFFVNEYGKVECARVDRYGSTFSVLLVRVESFGNGERKAGGDELKKFMEVLKKKVIEVVRNCDVAGLIDERSVLIILPRTDYFGSLITVKKLTKAIEHQTVKGEPFASVYISQATYPKDAVGYGELSNVAVTRQLDIAASLWEKNLLKGKLFWEVVAFLTSGSLKGADYYNFDIGETAQYDEMFIHRLNESIIREIARSPEKRGVLYIASKNITASMPILKSVAKLGKVSSKIFFVGSKIDNDADLKNATFIPINDPRIDEMLFTLYLTENSSYALICKESWGNVYNSFHTSNSYMVEGLITKFQRDNYLQELL